MIEPSDLKILGRIIAHELYDLQKNGKVLISQNEAFRLYGRTKIEHLVRIGRLEGKKEGNRITYNRKRIENLLWQI